MYECVGNETCSKGGWSELLSVANEGPTKGIPGKERTSRMTLTSLPLRTNDAAAGKERKRGINATPNRR